MNAINAVCHCSQFANGLSPQSFGSVCPVARVNTTMQCAQQKMFESGAYKFVQYAMNSLLFAMILIIATNTPAFAEDRLTDMVKEARSAEAQRDYSNAGMQYYSILQNDIIERHANVPNSIKSGLARRAAACLTIAARSDMERISDYEGWAHSENLNMLEKTWEILQGIEPNNPTWYYLRSTRACSQGRYHDARTYLQQSLRTTGGQPSVRQKSKALLAHINKFADQDLAKLNRTDAYSLQMLMSGQLDFHTGVDHSSPSSSDGGWKPDTISDSERRARDAESHGDYGAASRFRSGGTTVQDGSKYW